MKGCFYSALAVILSLAVSAGMTPAFGGEGAAGSRPAGTFFVAPDGDDENPGTAEAPWGTLAKASREAMAGDTVLLLPGTYPGTLRPLNSGTAEAPITFRAVERRTARLVGDPPRGHVVEIDGVSFIQIHGIHIRPEPVDGHDSLTRGAAHATRDNHRARTMPRWMMVRNASHVTVEDVLMEQTAAGDPFQILDSEQVQVRDSVFRQNVHNMVIVTGSSRVLFEGNAISRVGHSPFRFIPAGSNEYVVVRGNVFHTGWGRSFELFGPRHVLFEGNIVTNAFNGGRSNTANAKFGVENGIFRFNRVFRNWSGPLHVHGARAPVRAQAIRLYHNVFDDNWGYAFSVSRPEARDIIFANNIFSRNDPHGGGRHVHITRLGGAGYVRFLNNAFFGGTEGASVIDFAGAVFTLGHLQTAAWRREHGEQFVANLDVDPGYAGPAAYDHSLSRDSPLLGAGRPLTRARESGRGSELPVEDAAYFYDGFGISGERGDLIAVGHSSRIARVVRADRENNVLTLDRPIRWRAEDPVSLPWSGTAPDVGLFDHGGGGRASVQVVVEPFPARPGEEVRLRAVLRGISEPAEVRWQLGDGTIGHGAELTHTYQNEYDYPIRVRVTDGEGNVHRAAGYALVETARPAGAAHLHTTFDADDESWWRLWQSYRPFPADSRRILDPDTGRGKLHVFAPEARGNLPAFVHPAPWRIDRHPVVRIRYRIVPGTPVALYLQAFETPVEERRLFVAEASAARPPEHERAREPAVLLDDGEWHEITLDARAIRERFPDVEVLEGLRFHAAPRGAVEVGHAYWLEDVLISAEE